MRPPGSALPSVLVIAPHFAPDVDAGAVRLTSLAAELARLGHAVTVVAPGTPTSSERFVVRRVAVPARGRGSAANALHQVRLLVALRREALRAVRDSRPDVVFCSSPPPVAALAGVAAAERGGVPLVVDFRDLWPDVLVEAGAIGARSIAARGLRWVESRLLAGAARVTTVTTTKKQRLESRTSRPVDLVANGIDAAWRDGGEPHAGGGDDGAFEVLYAGNVGRAQDVALLAEAVAGLRDESRGRRIVATIVGDGESRAEVAAWAARAPDVVSLLPPESRDAVKARLARCGAVFVTLRTSDLVDAVPSKMLEAMGRGVPVILAAAGESADVLRAARGGMVATPGSVASLRETLIAMAALTSGERRAMGARGREHVVVHSMREDAAATLSRTLCAVVEGSAA
jgi:colanic acid biosynthesis glycosyl transferase WcaI